MSIRSSLARIPGLRAANRLARRGLARVRSALGPAPRAADADSPETLAIRVDLWGLAVANRISRKPVVDPNSPVVLCTTTHGDRIETIYTAIESVARGDVLPRRLMLWLDDPKLVANLPKSIRRLQKRGLEVMEVAPGYKVHTKYYPYVASVDEHVLPLVSSEDDIVYPRTWLAGLIDKYRENPDCLITYRSHTVSFTKDGLGPYATWTPTISDVPSYRHFGTTVSGQIYSPSFLNFVKSKGDAFTKVSPNQDDLWLHHLSIQAGVRTLQVTRDQQHFPFVPGTQAHGLFWVNVAGGQNDVQASNTYTAADITKMRADPE